MTKYAVVLSGIIEADSANEAIQIFTEAHDYNNIECFEYGNEPHPFDGDVTCQDLVDIGLKPQGAGMKTKRTITIKECPWLDKDIPAGTEVYDYLGCTYGCISPSGIAVSFQKNADPFFEIPRDAVKE